MAGRSQPADSPPDAALLKLRAVKFNLDIPQTMRWVTATYGVGRLRQIAGLARAALGRSRIPPNDYFAYGLFRPAMTEGERGAYVSIYSGQRLNLQLSPPSLRAQHGLVADKLLTGLVLSGAGFPVPPVLAAYLPQPGPRPPGLRVLDTPAALADWLLTEAPYPVFGKPIDGSLALGSAGIVGAEGRDLRLADGRRVPAAALVDEVARNFHAGWLIQPHLVLHPEVSVLAGTAVSFLRVCTLREPGGVTTLYTVFRLPAAGVMIDATTTKGPNGLALVESETGAILRAQSMWRLSTSALEVSTATGEALAGRRLPFVPEACRLCEAAHALFPAHGVLGWDVALTLEGPVLVEVNANPHHSQYQRPADRGVLNPDLRPRIEAALAESTRRLAVEKAEQDRIARKT